MKIETKCGRAYVGRGSSARKSTAGALIVALPLASMTDDVARVCPCTPRWASHAAGVSRPWLALTERPQRRSTTHKSG